MRKIILIIYTLSLNLAVAQTNLFTPADGGTFETSASDGDIYSAVTSPSWELTRSTDYAYTGNYSLACAAPQGFLNNRSARTEDFDVFDDDYIYMLRMKVYVPSSSTISSGTIIKPGLKTGAVVFPNCGEPNYFEVGVDPYNTWFEITVNYPLSSTRGGSYYFNLWLTNSTNTGVFYIDDIEVLKYTPISDNSTVDLLNGNISLNPTGGMVGYDYEFQWSDGATSQNRTGLAPDNYTVLVNSEGFEFCQNQFTYDLTIPKPSVTNHTPNVCLNDQIRLTASSTVTGAEFSWYSQSSGGTLLGTGSEFQDVKSVAGTYTYYVQADVVNGSSFRTTVSVTVHPNPDVSMGDLDDFYYVSRSSVTLTGSPSGGTFTGPGVTGNIFNPSQAGLGVHTISYTYTDSEGCTGTATQIVEVVESDPLCRTAIPVDGTGQFAIDTYGGRIVYQNDATCAEDIDMMCISTEATPPIIDHIVATNAVSLSDNWDYSSYYTPKSGGLSASNNYEKGKKGKWRVDGSYTYNSKDIYRGKNYNTGTYNLNLFNWQHPDVNQRTGWIKTTTVEHYSPNGDALQERNALGIASVAKFGYNDAVPFLTAQNADHGSVRFESFEMLYSGVLEEGDNIGALEITPNNGHAGNKSLKLRSGDKFLYEKMAVPAINTSMLAKVWVKGTPSLNGLKFKAETEDGLTLIALASFQKISSSGAWSLYRAQVNLGSHQQFQVLVGNEGSTTIWIDDLRVQPADAQMSTYVYDPQNLRLLAVFDDQHYGMFYHYNAEGKLVRKQLETERGTQTLQETFYNLPSQE
ncbi:hypothetical protein C900_04432 [Fulvivirga imtechensis AK7]|uniref:Ig-like domain-containing protein n=1 Tax=Fulvivirga imtechensis AK7 TaxID=1237149 RepID=L8JP58_9BACT|nr:hypothetical protein [Fulvivirga imtechensis]ELR69988.1 hypothetical protein C900_04432 [Fulvivirga imtechensis AK7]